VNESFTSRLAPDVPTAIITLLPDFVKDGHDHSALRMIASIGFEFLIPDTPRDLAGEKERADGENESNGNLNRGGGRRLTRPGSSFLGLLLQE
jgi:hypothetical protein